MNWKDILIGAIASLIVTIIAGLAVYYITREPAKSKEENLIYNVEPVSTFETENTKLAILNVRILNIGNAPATDVKVSIDLPTMIEIKDKSILVSSGKVSGLRIDTAAGHQLSFFLPSLIPDEKVLVSLLLSAKPLTEAAVLVKSNASLGKRDDIEIKEKPATSSDMEQIIAIVLFILTLLLSISVYYYFRSRGLKYPPSVNNNAFALLHQGMSERANELLSKAIEKGRDGPYPLSNLAVYLALNGDIGKAEKYLRAAAIWPTRET